MKKIYNIIALMLIVSLVINGCSSGAVNIKDNTQYEIGLIIKARNSEYWMSVVSGIEKAASDYNVTAIILSSETEMYEEQQKKMIYDMIDKGVDALAVSPINSYDCKDFVQYANAKGIPILSFDAEISGEGVPYIGIDNEQAGFDAAKSMVEKIGKTGSVGIIAGDQRQAPHKKRVEGFLNYLKTYTDIQVDFLEGGYSNRRMSEENLSKLLKTYPDIKGIFTTSAVTALGVVEYVGSDDICIASVDAQSDALQEVKEGRLHVLVSQRGYDIGYETVKYMVDSLNGEKLETQKIINADIITTENVDEYNNEED